MKTPDSSNYPQSHPSEDLSISLNSKKVIVLEAISTLLEGEEIKDETDRNTVSEAKAFIESDTENLSEIQSHTTKIGQVIAGYEMQGDNAPPAIETMYCHLLMLSCINRIRFIEGELEKVSPDTAQIKQAMVWALDPATHLSRGYKDNTLLMAVKGLQDRI